MPVGSPEADESASDADSADDTEVFDADGDAGTRAFVESGKGESGDDDSEDGDEDEVIEIARDSADSEGMESDEVRGRDVMLVNASEQEELRIAVLDERNVLEELYVDTIARSSVLGNIYKGRVVNVEPSIGAAFIDFGIGRNGFLHASDVLAAYGDPAFELTDLPLAKAGEDEGPEAVRAVVEDSDERKVRPPGDSHRDRKSIADLLHRGQEVVVQVTKDGIGLKGPTLTTYISIPGRSLVLMPSLPRCGVSRKISDEKERRRLKKILLDIVPDPNLGFIVRTAGENRTRGELQRDLDYLMNLWDVFKKRLVASRAPILMYEESDLCITTMRDIFSPSIGRVVVDSEPVYKRMREFCERIMPRYAERFEFWTEPTPIFHRYSVEAEFQKLFLRKVTLANGSSLVFDQAEALVAIDVNSGKARQESDLEETAYRTNMEAIPEIVRQIRLRDLGGIVVVDFIDMMEPRHRRQVEKAFRDAMRNDRARIKIGRISQFGLLELTRQRLGPGLQRSLFQPCTACGGAGYAKTPEAMSLSVLREVTAAVRKKGFATIEVAVHPDALHYLVNVKRENLYHLEERSGKNIIAVGDQRLGPGEVRFRYLTVEGRETKPVSS
ncbi:MAG: ribonuclease E/G [Planctomycetota bacterium]